MGNLEGRVAVVTGAARGQGRAHAEALAAAGADVVVADLAGDLPPIPYSLGTLAELEETAHRVSRLGRRALAVRCDVRSARDVEALVRAARAEFGGIDVLVNNAGVCAFGAAWELTEEEWAVMLDVNLTGVWRTCRAAVPHMMERGWGRIINIASVAGLKGMAWLSHYAAARHGVIGFTRSLALELAPYGVTANCICPGSVDSPMLDGLAPLTGLPSDQARQSFAARHRIPGLIAPQAVASLCVWLAGDEARYVTGAAIPVDAGWLQN